MDGNMHKWMEGWMDGWLDKWNAITMSMYAWKQEMNRLIMSKMNEQKN